MPLQNYYHVVNEATLPSAIDRKNVVLTLDGMYEISVYYKEKYNIMITPLAVAMEIDSENASFALCAAVNRAKEHAKHQLNARCGFVLHNIKAKPYGHAMPVIWEKSADVEKLFLLDAGQYLGDTSYDDRACDFIFKTDFSSNTDLNELPGDAPTAYVLCNDEVIFIDKATNERFTVCDLDDEVMVKNL